MIVHSPLGLWNLEYMTWLHVDTNKMTSLHVIKVHWPYSAGMMAGGDQDVLAAFHTRDEADEMLRRIGLALSEGIPFIGVGGVDQQVIVDAVKRDRKAQEEARRAQEENE